MPRYVSASRADVDAAMAQGQGDRLHGLWLFLGVYATLFAAAGLLLFTPLLGPGSEPSPPGPERRDERGHWARPWGLEPWLEPWLERSPSRSVGDEPRANQYVARLTHFPMAEKVTWIRL